MLGRVYGGQIMPPSHEAVRPGNRPARRRIAPTLVQETPVEKEKRILARERLNLGDQQMAQIDDPATLGYIVNRNQGMSQGQRTAQNLKDNLKANILAAYRKDQDLQEHYAEQRRLARPRRQRCSLAGYSRMKKSDLVSKLANVLPKATQAELKKFTLKQLRKVAKNHCSFTSRGGAIDEDERLDMGREDRLSSDVRFHTRHEDLDPQHGPVRRGRVAQSVYSRPPIGGEPVRIPYDVVRHINTFVRPEAGFERLPDKPQRPAWAEEGDDYVPRSHPGPGLFRFEGYQFVPSEVLPNLKPDKKQTKKKRKRDAMGGMIPAPIP